MYYQFQLEVEKKKKKCTTNELIGNTGDIHCSQVIKPILVLLLNSHKLESEVSTCFAVLLGPSGGFSP